MKTGKIGRTTFLKPNGFYNGLCYLQFFEHFFHYWWKTEGIHRCVRLSFHLSFSIHSYIYLILSFRFRFYSSETNKSSWGTFISYLLHIPNLIVQVYAPGCQLNLSAASHLVGCYCCHIIFCSRM